MEKRDKSVCVGVRIKAKNNDDTTIELEPESMAIVRGSGRGCGRGHRCNTTHFTSKK